MRPNRSPLSCCKGCSYLGERPQKDFETQLFYNEPFCEFSQLHFDSIRQIDNLGSPCIHYDETE